MALRYIILGGGVSGLAAGWRLAERQAEVDVLEAGASVGGLAGTTSDGGCHLDLGPHSFFSDDADVVRHVLALLSPLRQARQRQVKLFYGGRYLDYPLSARSVLLQMGIGAGARAAASFLARRLRPRRLAGGEPTVRDWAVDSFGDHLYRTFFKPYTEQFWDVPCDELCARAIPAHTRTGFASTLRLLLSRGPAPTANSMLERERLPTYSPGRGFFEIPAAMAASVTRAGGRIHHSCRALRVELLRGGGFLVGYRRGGVQSEIAAERLISTIPLPHLVGMLRPPPPAAVRAAAARLEYRSLVVLGLLIRRERPLGCDYLYQLDRPYSRLFDMSQFSPRSSPEGSSVLGVEIPCREGDAVWRATREELFERCAGSLAADGFLRPGEVSRLLLARAPHAYPVYRKGYARHLRCVLEHLGAVGSLATLGRSGEFRYMDVDRCVRRAFDLADDLSLARVA